jgi:hypothetical protein
VVGCLLAVCLDRFWLCGRWHAVRASSEAVFLSNRVCDRW